MNPDVMTDATVVKFAVIAAVILVILGLLDRGSGSIFNIMGRISSWMDLRRRSVRESDDERVNDMLADIDYLKGQVQYLRHQMEERDKRARAHHRWDHKVFVALLKVDPVAAEAIGEPPSLYPETIDPVYFTRHEHDQE